MAGHQRAPPRWAFSVSSAAEAVVRLSVILLLQLLTSTQTLPITDNVDLVSCHWPRT